MLNAKPSFVVDTIHAWLLDNHSNTLGMTKNQIQTAINLTTQQLGYGEPFNAEQKAINEMLFDRKADAQTCQAAWGFYHDFTHGDEDITQAA